MGNQTQNHRRGLDSYVRDKFWSAVNSLATGCEHVGVRLWLATIPLEHITPSRDLPKDAEEELNSNFERLSRLSRQRRHVTVKPAILSQAQARAGKIVDLALRVERSSQRRRRESAS